MSVRGNKLGNPRGIFTGSLFRAVLQFKNESFERYHSLGQPGPVNPKAAWIHLVEVASSPLFLCGMRQGWPLGLLFSRGGRGRNLFSTNFETLPRQGEAGAGRDLSGDSLSGAVAAFIKRGCRCLSAPCLQSQVFPKQILYPVSMPGRQGWKGVNVQRRRGESNV